MRATLFRQIKVMFLLAGIFACNILCAQTRGRQLYQLKSFTLGTLEQEKLTDYYLEEAYLPALKRQGLSNVGVFKRHRSDKDTLRQVFVLFPLSSLNQVAAIDNGLRQDKLYEKVGAPFLQAPHESPPFLRVESTLMIAFQGMPAMKPSPLTGPREDRVYELRSYESPTEHLYRNKVEMFNAGGEVSLFERLGFNAVFYAEVLSGAQMPNLMYMTTFDDMETRDELWRQFFDSETWKSLEKDPKYQNNVNHADIYLLYPTPYSDY